MIFASSVFLFLFLPITLVVYFLIRPEFRNFFLLLVSIAFYAWGEPVYVFLMIGSILLNYIVGVLLHLQRRKSTKFLTEQKILLIGIVGNLVLLFYFKYANFFINNFNIILQHMAIKPIDYSQISSPAGISFFTFQAMSYVVDIYRKEANIQLNPVKLGLYVSFFPKLMAGPIVCYHDVAKQIVSRTITISRFSSGIQRFIFGLAKKTMIANPLGEVADKIFSVPINDITTGMAWLGIVCYTIQIYFDFSGYSDMAIGLGRMFGFEFFENFSYPYISRSIREFWRKWHISLSTWLREYLYIPLGGNRGSSFRTYLNLWTVFLICGLWHGASWNFVIWGALHGTFLVIERAGLGTMLDRLWRPLQHAYALSVIIIGWVFFRSESLTQAMHYLASMIGFTNANGIKYYALFYLDSKIVLTLIVSVFLATPIARQAGVQLYSRFEYSQLCFFKKFLFGSGYYCLLLILSLLSAAYLAAGTYNSFIYFRF